MKIRTFLAGNKGYLYVDLLVALTILSITVISLFSAGRNIKLTSLKIESEYKQTLEIYEKTLLEQSKE